MFDAVRLIPLLALGSLAACGGAGGSSLDDIGTAGGSRLDDIDTAGEAMFDSLQEYEITAVEDLPRSGRASYDGYVGFSVHSDDSVLDVAGRMQLETDLDPAAADPVTGRAYDFATEDESRLEGQLRIDNGSFDRAADPETDYQFAADMHGTLREDGDDYRVDAFLEGDFLGEGREGVSGYVSGDIWSDAEAPIAELEGGFVGER